MSAGAERLRRATAWLLALGVLIVALMGGVGWVQWRQSALMSQASLVGGDNMMHFLYQADNEYLRLREGWPHPGMAAPVASHADGAAETLQLRYEIFVSRINVLRNALKRHDLHEDAQVMAALAQVGTQPMLLHNYLSQHMANIIEALTPLQETLLGTGASWP